MIIIKPNGKEIIDWLNLHVGMTKPTKIPTQFIKGEGWSISITSAFDPKTSDEYIAWDIEISDPKLETLFILRWRYS